MIIALVLQLVKLAQYQRIQYNPLPTADTKGHIIKILSLMPLHYKDTHSYTPATACTKGHITKELTLTPPPVGGIRGHNTKGLQIWSYLKLVQQAIFLPDTHN